MNNINKALNAISAKKKKIETNIQKGVAECCLQVQRTIVKGMTETQTDVTKSYYKHNKKIAHHPSEEGNYPAVDTGNLRRSITFKVNEEEKKVIGKIGTTLKYGAILEYGYTKGNRVLAPRPWLRPSMEKEKDFIESKIKEVVRKEK